MLILDGNSEIGAHFWREIGYLICLRHLIGAVVNRISFLLKRVQHALSYHKMYHNIDIVWSILW